VSEPAAASNTATDCPYCSLQCAMQIVQQPGEWEMYVGGAAIAHLRKGDLLCTVDDPDAAMLMTGRFIQYYRENARWLERTYGFMERIGVDTVRAVLVDDRDRDGERLDAELERSLSAYPHGWRAASPSRPTSSRLRSEPSADRAWQFAGEFDGGYRPIGEHGLVGDLHTVALVGTDGTIDWYLAPPAPARPARGSPPRGRARRAGGGESPGTVCGECRARTTHMAQPRWSGA